MHSLDLKTLLADPIFQQLVPFLILFGVPALVFLARAPAAALAYRLYMFFDSLAALIGRTSSQSSGSSTTSSRKLKKKGVVRSRAEQQAALQNGHAGE
jgi:hypothetical protein